MKSVSLVVVFYKPQKIHIENILRLQKINEDELSCIAVVNEITNDLFKILKSDSEIPIHIILNDENKGIAKAINQGISLAINDLSPDYIILSDQDSTLSSNIISSLIKIAEIAKKDNVKIGSISPTLKDTKGDIFKSQGVKSNPHYYIEKTTVATSGQMIPIDSIKEIGMMDESLFIDGVDHEWCFRAKSKGYEILRANDIILNHDLGNSTINFFKKTKPIHYNPIRQYYIIRNSLFLIRRNYIPIEWRILEILKTLRRFFGYLIYSKEKKKTLFFMLRGVNDAIKSISGKFNS